MMFDSWSSAGAFLMTAFWLLVIVGVFALLLAIGRPDLTTTRGAARSLAERFTRGEIDVEEFRSRRGALEEADALRAIVP